MRDEHIYYKPSAQHKDKMEQLPEPMIMELAAHMKLYQNDPEKAHMWDSSLIGLTGIVSCLMLTAKGAKTGQTRKNVLQYYKVDKQYVVVGSRGGTIEHPLWYRNLCVNPECEIQVGSFHAKATARTISDDERPSYWKKITAEQPVQIEYQKRTSRQIPVIVFDLET